MTKVPRFMLVNSSPAVIFHDHVPLGAGKSLSGNSFRIRACLPCARPDEAAAGGPCAGIASAVTESPGRAGTMRHCAGDRRLAVTSCRLKYAAGTIMGMTRWGCRGMCDDGGI